jgi:hypothetical protein
LRFSLWSTARDMYWALNCENQSIVHFTFFSCSHSLGVLLTKCISFFLPTVNWDFLIVNIHLLTKKKSLGLGEPRDPPFKTAHSIRITLRNHDTYEYHGRYWILIEY